MRRWLAEITRRAEVRYAERSMLAMEERLLRDIGLTRAAAEAIVQGIGGGQSRG